MDTKHETSGWTEHAIELAADHPRGTGNLSAYCPTCGAGASGYTCAVAEKGNFATAVPSEGCAAICAYCGAWNVYRADQTLRPASNAERAEIQNLLSSPNGAPKE